MFRLGELFSGPGGLGLAAQRTGAISHQWATDRDPDACQTYRQNLCPDSGSVVCADIRTLDYQVLADLGDIDGLAFGFPCNDFSLVGQRRGLEGEYGPLYRYGIQALERFSPQWFVAENVGGIRGDALNMIAGEMRQAGYRVTAHYYRFEDYGVPQARHRVVIVGIRNDLDVTFAVPAPFDADVSVKTALAGIPADAANHEFSAMSQTVRERLSFIPPGGNAWHPDVPGHLRIHTKTQLSSIYRRLHPDKPAYTVTGSGGGGTHIYHWDQLRALTNRERARLQTFPDDFVFAGSRGSVRKQIGMAVPPAGAEVIFQAIIDSFAGRDYPSVPASM